MTDPAPAAPFQLLDIHHHPTGGIGIDGVRLMHAFMYKQRAWWFRELSDEHEATVCGVCDVCVKGGGLT